jgi:zinc protease
MSKSAPSADNSVLKTRLPNGLTVVLKPMHHAPVASFWIWYRVGSRNERPGHTGIAHWVEHMMFKGTPHFPPGTLDRTVSREGGRWNAFTWLDFTAYYETLPADRIDLALRLESDRMVNTIMTGEATESERTVILSERHMYENQPMFLLGEELQAAAFRVHSYHHEVIGDEADLLTMSRDDLYQFYQRYYAPDNATAVVVGDFDPQEMLAKINDHFGRLPAANAPAPVIRPEPPQRGERQVTRHGPGDTTLLMHAWKAPAANDPDYYPLALLNAAFTGGGSLGMFGGGGSNKSSRLYRALVSADLAVAVHGSVTPTIDPYLITIVCVLHPAADLAALESALDAEIGRLATHPLTIEELGKARKRARVQFVRAGESITGQAQLLGMGEAALGDYAWAEKALARLEAVTLDDIERVRARWLNSATRTVARYVPDNGAQE